MNIQLRIILIVTSIIAMLFLMKKIRNFKLQIEYALFWVLIAGFFIVLAVFPQIAYFMSDIMGFRSPSNMVFLLIIAVLLLKTFMMTIEIDTLDKKVKELIQTIALNEKDEQEDKEV